MRRNERHNTKRRRLAPTYGKVKAAVLLELRTYETEASEAFEVGRLQQLRREGVEWSVFRCKSYDALARLEEEGMVGVRRSNGKRNGRIESVRLLARGRAYADQLRINGGLGPSEARKRARNRPDPFHTRAYQRHLTEEMRLLRREGLDPAQRTSEADLETAVIAELATLAPGTGTSLVVYAERYLRLVKLFRHYRGSNSADEASDMIWPDLRERWIAAGADIPPDGDWRDGNRFYLWYAPPEEPMSEGEWPAWSDQISAANQVRAAFGMSPRVKKTP